MRYLISETKIDNTIPVSHSCVPGDSVRFRSDMTGRR